MIKIIFLADTHLGFDFPLRPKKDKRRRGPDFFNNFDRVLSYAKQNEADLIIHGGDLFYRTLVPAPIVDLVYERIFNIANYGIPVVIVPGNHESARLPVSLFVQHPNIHYFKKPQVFRFKLKGVELDIAGFPCIRKDVKNKFPEIVAEIKKQLNPTSKKFLCMHQTIEGAKVGPSGYTFRSGDDVIPIRDIPEGFDLVLSGHIHRTQILWANGIPVIYPGSTERTAFAEKDERKGFYEIAIDDNHDITYQFIELETRPMVDIVLNQEEYTPSFLKEEIHNQLKGIPNDSVIRIKMVFPKNIYLLNVKLLDEVIPPTMNYQIAGLREAYNP